MTYPEALPVIITLNSVDVTDYVPPSSLQITNALTSEIDTCSLELIEAGSLDPREWQELVVTSGAERIFGGYVVGLNKTDGPRLDVNFRVDASDYSIRLDKVIVKKEYVNQTDAAIIEDLFDTYLPGEGFDYTTNVQAVHTYERIRFNRLTLLECILQLAEISRADWYVDPDKNLFFFERATNTTAAPFSISDSPNMTTSFPATQIQVDRDGVQVANRIEILGGNFRSDDAEFILPGTGQDNRIIVPFRFYPADGETSVLIDRNDGTLGTPAWTPLTVKPAYISEISSTDDVLYYFQEKVIEQTDNWPNLANAVRINAKYEVPLRTRVQDAASITFYGLILDDVIIDENIVDKNIARAAGLAKLAEGAIAQPAVRFEVLEFGLKAGQVVTIENDQYGLSSDFVIQRVTTNMGSGNFVRYSVTAGVYNPDLIDLMLMLTRQAKPKAPWRDDEVLDELLQIAETVSFTEAIDITDSEPPYYFSEDPLEAFDWGFGSFDP